MLSLPPIQKVDSYVIIFALEHIEYSPERTVHVIQEVIIEVKQKCKGGCFEVTAA